MRLICLILLGLCLGCSNSTDDNTRTHADASRPQAGAHQSDEDRQKDFDARPQLTPPGSLPGSWKKLLSGCNAKLESASVRRGSHQTQWKGRTDIQLTFRMFGTDSDVNDRLARALKKLKLPNFSGAAENQAHETKTRSWSLELNRLVAPKNAQRQTQVVFRWSRFPSPVSDKGKCRKPQPMDADIRLPQWMRTHSTKRSTRRRVVSEIETNLSEYSGQVVMLYHNGYAHDEGVNHFSSGLKRAGFAHQNGSGPNQNWSHDDGSEVIFSSIGQVHDMGCTIAGPLLAVQWRSPKEGD